MDGATHSIMNPSFWQREDNGCHCQARMGVTMTLPVCICWVGEN